MRTLTLLALVLAAVGCDSNADTPDDDDDNPIISGIYTGERVPENASRGRFTFDFGDEGLAPGVSDVRFSYFVLDGPTEDEYLSINGVSGGGTVRVTYGADGAFSFTCSPCEPSYELTTPYSIQGSGTATSGRIELDLTGTAPTNGLVLTPQ